MVKLIWTDQAIDDLGHIADYIADNSEKYARRTVKKLYESADILKQFPLIGRVVPEKNEINLRELIDGNYRIIYEVMPGDIIYVLTVHHSSKDLKI